MLIAYETLLHLKPEEHGETTEFMACAHSRVMLTLSTDDFRVEYKDGKANVHLARHLTHEQTRELARVLIETADKLEQQERDWHVSMQATQEMPAGSRQVIAVTVPMEAVPTKVGYGG